MKNSFEAGEQDQVTLASGDLTGGESIKSSSQEQQNKNRDGDGDGKQIWQPHQPFLADDNSGWASQSGDVSAGESNSNNSRKRQSISSFPSAQRRFQQQQQQQPQQRNPTTRKTSTASTLSDRSDTKGGDPRRNSVASKSLSVGSSSSSGGSASGSQPGTSVVLHGDGRRSSCLNNLLEQSLTAMTAATSDVGKHHHHKKNDKNKSYGPRKTSAQSSQLLLSQNNKMQRLQLPLQQKQEGEEEEEEQEEEEEEESEKLLENTRPNPLTGFSNFTMIDDENLEFAILDCSVGFESSTTSSSNQSTVLSDSNATNTNTHSNLSSTSMDGPSSPLLKQQQQSRNKTFGDLSLYSSFNAAATGATTTAAVLCGSSSAASKQLFNNINSSGGFDFSQLMTMDKSGGGAKNTSSGAFGPSYRSVDDNNTATTTNTPSSGQNSDIATSSTSLKAKKNNSNNNDGGVQMESSDVETRFGGGEEEKQQAAMDSSDVLVKFTASDEDNNNNNNNNNNNINQKKDDEEKEKEEAMLPGQPLPGCGSSSFPLHLTQQEDLKQILQTSAVGVGRVQAETSDVEVAFSGVGGVSSSVPTATVFTRNSSSDNDVSRLDSTASFQSNGTAAPFSSSSSRTGSGKGLNSRNSDSSSSPTSSPASSAVLGGASSSSSPPLPFQAPYVEYHVAVSRRNCQIFTVARMHYLNRSQMSEVIKQASDLMSRCVHTNVQRVYGLVYRAQQHLLDVFLEYVPDTSVVSFVSSVVHTEHQVSLYIQQFVAGLDAIHSAGLAHFNIKPSSVVVTEAGTIKICDFFHASKFIVIEEDDEEVLDATRDDDHEAEEEEEQEDEEDQDGEKSILTSKRPRSPESSSGLSSSMNTNYSTMTVSRAALSSPIPFRVRFGLPTCGNNHWGQKADILSAGMFLMDLLLARGGEKSVLPGFQQDSFSVPSFLHIGESPVLLVIQLRHDQLVKQYKERQEERKKMAELEKEKVLEELKQRLKEASMNSCATTATIMTHTSSSSDRSSSGVGNFTTSHQQPQEQQQQQQQQITPSRFSGHLSSSSKASHCSNNDKSDLFSESQDGSNDGGGDVVPAASGGNNNSGNATGCGSPTLGGTEYSHRRSRNLSFISNNSSMATSSEFQQHQEEDQLTKKMLMLLKKKVPSPGAFTGAQLQTIMKIIASDSSKSTSAAASLAQKLRRSAPDLVEFLPQMIHWKPSQITAQLSELDQVAYEHGLQGPALHARTDAQNIVISGFSDLASQNHQIVCYVSNQEILLRSDESKQDDADYDEQDDGKEDGGAGGRLSGGGLAESNMMRLSESAGTNSNNTVHSVTGSLSHSGGVPGNLTTSAAATGDDMQDTVMEIEEDGNRRDKNAVTLSFERSTSDIQSQPQQQQQQQQQSNNQRKPNMTVNLHVSPQHHQSSTSFSFPAGSSSSSGSLLPPPKITKNIVLNDVPSEQSSGALSGKNGTPTMMKSGSNLEVAPGVALVSLQSRNSNSSGSGSSGSNKSSSSSRKNVMEASANTSTTVSSIGSVKHTKRTTSPSSGFLSANSAQQQPLTDLKALVRDQYREGAYGTTATAATAAGARARSNSVSSHHQVLPPLAASRSRSGSNPPLLHSPSTTGLLSPKDSQDQGLTELGRRVGASSSKPVVGVNEKKVDNNDNNRYHNTPLISVFDTSSSRRNSNDCYNSSLSSSTNRKNHEKNIQFDHQSITGFPRGSSSFNSSYAEADDNAEQQQQQQQQQKRDQRFNASTSEFARRGSANFGLGIRRGDVYNFSMHSPLMGGFGSGSYDPDHSSNLAGGGFGNRNNNNSNYARQQYFGGGAGGGKYDMTKSVFQLQQFIPLVSGYLRVGDLGIIPRRGNVRILHSVDEVTNRQFIVKRFDLPPLPESVRLFNEAKNKKKSNNNNNNKNGGDDETAAIAITSKDRLQLVARQKILDKVTNEVKLLKAAGSHPDVVQLFGSIFKSSENLVVMLQEYIGGRTLAQLRERIRFTESQVQAIIKCVLNILNYLHNSALPRTAAEARAALDEGATTGSSSENNEKNEEEEEEDDDDEDEEDDQDLVNNKKEGRNEQAQEEEEEEAGKISNFPVLLSRSKRRGGDGAGAGTSVSSSSNKKSVSGEFEVRRKKKKKEKLQRLLNKEQKRQEEQEQEQEHLLFGGIGYFDLKPHNIMLTPDGRVKLIDFGDARVLRNGNVPSEMKRMRPTGTTFFMPPEMFDEKFSFRCDTWAVGACVIHLLDGLAPFANRGLHGAQSYVSSLTPESDFTPPLSKTSGYSELCHDFVATCMTIDPLKRPSCETLNEHPWMQTRHMSCEAGGIAGAHQDREKVAVDQMLFSAQHQQKVLLSKQQRQQRGGGQHDSSFAASTTRSSDVSDMMIMGSDEQEGEGTGRSHYKRAAAAAAFTRPPCGVLNNLQLRCQQEAQQQQARRNSHHASSSAATGLNNNNNNNSDGGSRRDNYLDDPSRITEDLDDQEEGEEGGKKQGFPELPPQQPKETSGGCFCC